MQCPKCGGDSRVIDSARDTNFEGGKCVRRRRSCIDCRHRWSTRELDFDHLIDVAWGPSPTTPRPPTEEVRRQTDAIKAAIRFLEEVPLNPRARAEAGELLPTLQGALP